MQTFKKIREEIFGDLKETVDNNGHWTIADVDNAINDTYLFIADETFCFFLEDIVPIRADIRKYKLPGNFIGGSLKRVEFDEKRIFPITSEELDASGLTWRNSTGDPKRYFEPGDICGSDEIAFYPKPDTDGEEYNLALGYEDAGVVVAVDDTDSDYEEFETEEGVVVSSDGNNAEFDESEGTGPVQAIRSTSGNIRIFGAKYPKRLSRDEEVFLHPITYNPKRVINLGSLAILFAREGEGKDIIKASYYNKRFNETLDSTLKRKKSTRSHRMRSISEVSIGDSALSKLNLGDHYPVYYR